MQHTTKTIIINNEPTNYTITSDGIITNTKTGQVLTHALCGNYYKVSIMHNKTINSMYVHRLLAMHFLSEPQGLDNVVVDHIDGNRQNNSLSNLQFISQSDNCKKSTRPTEYNRVSEEVREELLEKYHNERMTGKALAEIYDLPLPTVYSICNRKKAA